MIHCPSCGQELPARARYCARCGAAVRVAAAWSPTPTVPPPSVPPPLAPPPGMGTMFGPGVGPPLPLPVAPARPRRGFPVWVLVLFYAGSALPLLLGLIYTLAAADPHLANPPGSGYSDATVKSSATTFAVALLVLFVAQLVAAVGLTLQQAWGRIVATFVCLAWMLTVIGIPVSVFALAAIWRRAH